jgi:hypothetical protein
MVVREKKSSQLYYLKSKVLCSAHGYLVNCLGDILPGWSSVEDKKESYDENVA